MQDFFNWLFGDKGQLVVAGALGGVVRWMTMRDRWGDGLIAVFVGAVCAFYLSPLVLPMLVPVLGGLQVVPESVTGISGFVAGIGGITLSGFVLDLWRARKRLFAKEQNLDGGSQE